MKKKYFLSFFLLILQKAQEKSAAKRHSSDNGSGDIPANTKERLKELETKNHQLKSLNSKITIQMTKTEQVRHFSS